MLKYSAPQDEQTLASEEIKRNHVEPDNSLWVPLFFNLPENKSRRMIGDVLGLNGAPAFTSAEIKEELDKLHWGRPERDDPGIPYCLGNQKFDDGEGIKDVPRDSHFAATIDLHYELIKHLIPEGVHVTEDQKHYLGHLFTKEYPVEGVASCNPSMVLAPDQSDARYGGKRVIMSVREIGEGHISSIGFRTGEVTPDGKVFMDAPVMPLVTGELKDSTSFDAALFKEKLLSMHLPDTMKVTQADADFFLKGLDNVFTYDAYKARVVSFEKEGGNKHVLFALKELDRTGYVQPSYEISFPPDTPLSSRVIFPKSIAESNGIEDVRWTLQEEKGKAPVYHGVATAYDGRRIAPLRIITKDFLTFKIELLSGKEAVDKNFAPFPEPINGQHAMIGRQNGDDNTIMFSKNSHEWNSYKILERPRLLRNIVQTGNCGSPVKIPGKGWLVLTHGVAANREYTIDAMLLDENDPSKVIAETKDPIIWSHGRGRRGQVPKVAYSCGPFRDGDNLIIPYAESDTSRNITTISIEKLLSKMVYRDKIVNSGSFVTDIADKREENRLRQR